MQLGRIKPTDEHRKKALPLSRYLTRALPPAPTAIDNSAGVAYALDDNDRYGNCTCVALANFFRTCATRDGRPLAISTADVDAFYFALTGGQDIGCVENDVLTRAQQGGFPLDGAHKLAAWVRIDQGDLASLRACAALFRAIYIGAELPIAAQSQDTWDATGDVSGDNAIGSWGGHAMIVPAYDLVGVQFVTWGSLKRATWAWVRTYVDEAYALLDAERATAAGVDWAALQADLQELQASP